MTRNGLKTLLKKIRIPQISLNNEIKRVKFVEKDESSSHDLVENNCNIKNHVCKRKTSFENYLSNLISHLQKR